MDDFTERRFRDCAVFVNERFAGFVVLLPRTFGFVSRSGPHESFKFPSFFMEARSQLRT